MVESSSQILEDEARRPGRRSLPEGLPCGAGGGRAGRGAQRAVAFGPVSKPNLGQGQTGTRGHILLVDDEEVFLGDLAEFLRGQGYRVDTATRGRAAMDCLDRREYALLVTDVRMPDMSGVELLRHTRHQHPDTEVILITGYGSKESVLEALRLGAYDYIEKPFEMLELLYSIVNCLENIELRRKNESLVKELQTHERTLERQVETKTAEVEAQGRTLAHMESLRQIVMTLTHSIHNASGTIWGYADLCRKMEKGYPEEVNRLIEACLLEGRKITADIESLKGAIQEIDGELYGDGEGDAAPAADAPMPPFPAAKAGDGPPVSEAEAESLYGALYAFVGEVLQAVEREEVLSLDPAFTLIARVVDTPGATDILYRRAIYTRANEETYGLESAVVLHSVNVAVYALKIGEGLHYTRNQLIDLGVASLVHDVGMVGLPPEIYTKDRLDKGDIERLRRHPQEAHDILIRLAAPYPWLAEIALQEHEREDGSGYPNGLAGDQIHEFAKIIGVADTYAGLTRARPGRPGLLPFEAVKEITHAHRHRFDARIVRVLLRKLSAFPIGSLVKLNSGAIGEVVETDEAHLLRPALRIRFDAEGRRVNEERIIHMQEHPILHITRPIFRKDPALQSRVPQRAL